MLSSHSSVLLLLLVLTAAAAAGAAGAAAATPAVDRLRRRILAGLGLDAVPDVTKMNVSREEYEHMYGVYLRTVEENRRTRRGRQAAAEVAPGALQLLTYTSSDGGDVQPPVRRWRHQRRRRVSSSEAWLQFSLPERHTAVVSHASLHVLLRAAESAAADGQPVTVRAYQLAPSLRRRRLLDERRVHLAADAPKWADFDVTHAAASWLEVGESDARLQLECAGCAQRNLTFGVLRDDAPALHILAEVFPDGASARHKRNVVEYEKVNFRQVKCRKEKPRCCRHIMPVVFKDIGFEFIRQPLTFDLGYCKGRCPREFNPVNNHAFFQSILWSKVKHDNKYGVPRPCCAPKRLEPLEILHLDEHDPKKLKRVVWDDMRVIECACA
ncbi:bone morphogenetic protein 2 [Schistocerca piceifrons]|uniref:bone morphogenetic protein 2 n=1 Tax=Schistocerca piceifrons TaxID=274613 RepID=UPI001F5E49E5|nr:bone morphogenetic protein 2 [Schistocerca piceifrons]